MHFCIVGAPLVSTFLPVCFADRRNLGVFDWRSRAVVGPVCAEFHVESGVHSDLRRLEHARFRQRSVRLSRHKSESDQNYREVEHGWPRETCLMVGERDGCVRL